MQYDRTFSRRLNLDLVDALGRRIDFNAYPSAGFASGQAILMTGDKVDRLPLVVEGSLDAVLRQMTDDGNTVMPVSWADGELAMTSMLFSRDPLGVDVVAAEDCRLRWIPMTTIEQAMHGDADLLVLVVRFLAQRLREVQDRERAWLERGVHERVVATLVRIAWAATPENGRVIVTTTHENLAARCGVSRSRLSGELKRLEDRGLVNLGRGSIEVVDRARLAAQMGGPKAG
jgi:CRP-like cAMP-binding protein